MPEAVILFNQKDESHENAENADEGSTLKLPEEMIQHINQIAESNQAERAAQNVEFTTQFAESLIQKTTSEKDVPKQTDLTTLPSSWTDFLLSPTKESSFKDGGRVDKAEHQIETFQKDIVDLDESTANVRQNTNVVDGGNQKAWFIPEDLPIDIRVKLVLCLIELKVNCNVQVRPQIQLFSACLVC